MEDLIKSHNQIEQLVQQATARLTALEESVNAKSLQKLDDNVWAFQSELLRNVKTFSELPAATILPPKRAKKQEAASKKKEMKWQTSLDSTHKIDFENATAIDISKIDLDASKVIGIERSEKGSEGLFFVDTVNGVYIAKRSFSIVSEALCNLLAMKLGIASPRFRIVNVNSQFGNDLLLLLRDKEKTGRLMATLCSQTAIILMQFVKGISFNQIESPGYVFGDIEGVGTLSAVGAERLQQIGRILALDVITNNCDRLPLVWDNRGNVGNLMVSSSGQIVAIDNKITGLDPESDKYSVYLNSVRALVKEVLTTPEKETKSFRRVRDALLASVGHDIQPEGSVAIQRGFLEIIKKSVEISLDEDLKRWEEELVKQKIEKPIFPQFAAQVWKEISQIVKNPPQPAPTRVAPSAPVAAPAPAPAPVQEKAPEKAAEPTPAETPANEAKQEVDLKNVKAIRTVEYSWKRITATGTVPTPRRYCSSVVVGDLMWVFGGVNVQKAALNDLLTLDMLTKTWTTIKIDGKQPSGRYGHSANLINGTMYIFGGSDSKGKPVADDFWQFDFKTKSWSEVKVASDLKPAPRFHHSAVLTPAGKINIYGGSADKSKHFDDMFEFSVETGHWQKRGTTGNPSPRAGHIALFWKENFFIFGGYTGDGGFERLADCYKLAAGSMVWEEVEIRGSLPMTGRPLPVAIDEEKGFVYIYGGFDGKAPLGTLLELHLDEMVGVAVKVWMELDESNITSSVVGSKGMTPLPRYGNVIGLHKGIVTVALGSASMYLNDCFEIDTNPDEDDDDEDEE